MSLVYELMYLVGFKPWDSGVTPPELVAAVEGPEALEPGRALDMGCGTGTNAVYLAKRGWEVTAIDTVGRPLKTARRKAEAAAVSPRFIQGDVTKLPELGVGGGYRLVFDLGCLHSVPA
jgi:2-polyprenyl-3-methyl-5-hydroxy-6-metoxy-1,4-benzoquinol methylase